MQLRLDPQICLPEGGLHGALAARVWLPGESGPAVAAVRPEGVFDISRAAPTRSEEHTSELQSLMRISYAVFCSQKKNNNKKTTTTDKSTTTRTKLHM